MPHSSLSKRPGEQGNTDTPIIAEPVFFTTNNVGDVCGKPAVYTGFMGLFLFIESSTVVDCCGVWQGAQAVDRR